MISIKLAVTGIGLSLLMIACGGGGGGGGGGADGGGGTVVVKSSLTGVAIDGYLENATAFLDLNDNGLLDNNEPQGKTNKQGQFTLEATDAEIKNHRVVVQVTTESSDSFTDQVDSAFKLMAPKGEGGVVSPLTTLVAAHMANGLSRQAAATKVQTDLGLANFDVMQNFMSSGNEMAQKMAVALTEVLKTISSNSLSQQLQDTRLSVENKISPIKDQILTFDVTKGWGGLKNQAKLFANPTISLALNDKWVNFLQKGNSPVVNNATLIIGNTPESKINPQFEMMRDDQGVNLSITYGNLKLKRILKINGTQLASIKSQYDAITETIQFEGNLPSLPNSVIANDAGSYFVEGTYTNSNKACAKANANYTIKPGNSTESLKFTLTLKQEDLEGGTVCIPSLFRPTTEIYEFTLTSDGLELNAVQATLSLGTLRLNF
jgi:hypothetical protein